MQILCKTFFDCSVTGVTGTFRPSHLPFVDSTGQNIDSFASWTAARNRQRNWETVLQMISLRAQPIIVTNPVQKTGTWEFLFEVETHGVYSTDGDPDNLDGLLKECSGIPMCVGLGESQTQQHQLITTGPEQNIWFETVNN